jgi:hypothetical protein
MTSFRERNSTILSSRDESNDKSLLMKQNERDESNNEEATERYKAVFGL